MSRRFFILRPAYNFDVIKNSLAVRTQFSEVKRPFCDLLHYQCCRSSYHRKCECQRLKLFKEVLVTYQYSKLSRQEEIPLMYVISLGFLMASVLHRGFLCRAQLQTFLLEMYSFKQFLLTWKNWPSGKISGLSQHWMDNKFLNDAQFIEVQQFT